MERVADYIIKSIRDAGAAHIFMLTGRGILYLSDAVAKDSTITPICTYHEQGASYAAMAYSAANRGVSACLVSTGCAATNAVTAALCAYQDNLPVVFISGQNMLHETTRYTGVPIRTYGSQEADIIKVVSSVTKYAVMLTDGAQARYEVEKALYLAQEGRPGPVWIDVPLDIQNQRIEPEQLTSFEPAAIVKPDLSGVAAQVAQELSAASRPVILVGGGVQFAGAELRQLVEYARIPLAFSPSAADIYGSGHELSVGAVGSLGGTRAGNFAVQNADYILAIGTKLCAQETGRRDLFAREAKITIVDIDPNEHTKNGVHLDRVITADAKDFLSFLPEICSNEVHETWLRTCLHWKEVFSISNEPFVQELRSADQLDLYSLLDSLQDVLPADATLITDAGFEELIVPSALRFRSGQRCLFPAAQGAMGYAIPAILGAHFAGRKHLIAVVGDGSFMMNMQELGLIAAHQIPVKILVINNNMYAVIRKRQKDLFRKRTIGNDPGDGVFAPDFEKVALSVGLPYQKIKSFSAWNSRKGTLILDEGPMICEIMCTPEQKYFHESYALNERRRLVHRPIEDMSPFLDRELIRSEMIVNMVEE